MIRRLIWFDWQVLSVGDWKKIEKYLYKSQVQSSDTLVGDARHLESQILLTLAVNFEKLCVIRFSASPKSTIIVTKMSLGCHRSSWIKSFHFTSWTFCFLTAPRRRRINESVDAWLLTGFSWCEKLFISKKS